MTTFYSLQNGLKVITIPRPGSGIVSLSMAGKAGSMYATPGEVGVAHFLEHMVLDATKDYPNEAALTGLIENYGGLRGGFTNKENVEYWAKIPKSYVENAFIFLSQITQFPLLRESDIVKHKGIIEQEINRLKTDPEMYVPRIAPLALYKDSIMGKLVTGDVEDIKKITRDTLLSFFERQYVASNFVLSICGDITPEESQVFAEKYFGSMKAGQATADTEPKKYPEKQVLVIPQTQAKQVALQINYYGFQEDTAEAVTADCLATILTFGKLGRLTRRVRDEHGLAYVIRSFHYAGRAYSTFFIYTGIAAKNIPLYLKIVQEELEKLMNTPISPEELEKAKALCESKTLFRFEDSHETSSTYADAHIGKTELTLHETYFKQIRAVTPEQIQACAKALFTQAPKYTVMGENIDESLFM